jgi:hypothetical protein
MSKLLEKLERISNDGGQPMGFGAVVSRTKISPMLTVASVPAGNAQLISIAAKEGADALLLTVENLEKDSKTLAKMNRAKAEIPWGVFLEKVAKEDIGQLIELGCDFIVFDPAQTQAAVLMEEKIGKVLRIDTSLPENLAKAINRLQVDVVLLNPVGGGETAFTVYQLMVLERLAVNTGKYVLMTMPPGLSTGDIEILWGLGARGVVVDMTLEQPEQRLSQVKEAIRQIPATHKKSREKFRATLPASIAPSEKPAPEEDEDEEP